jgi:hypothetical protein
MPQSATIKSLRAAFRTEGMQAEGVEWAEDYRAAAPLFATQSPGHTSIPPWRTMLLSISSSSLYGLPCAARGSVSQAGKEVVELGAQTGDGLGIAVLPAVGEAARGGRRRR